MSDGVYSKILLVDDNLVNLKVARNILMSKYDVFTVPSAEKMFVFLQKILPDLILLDVMMPDVTGYDAIKILKADPRTADIPVIFLTSKSEPESELEGLALGAVDYIIKPFSPPLLLKRIDLHILVKAQQRELTRWNKELQSLVEVKTVAVLKLQSALLRTMSNLVECRDDVTGGHIERTGFFLRLLMEEMRARGIYRDLLDTWDAVLFLQSAQLHDVGKIQIRDDILLKPGKLTNDEFDQMKRHTVFGEQIILKIEEDAGESAFLTHAKIMAGTHHERWNGRGYPRGLAGEEIPLQGRMMAIVDVYDALVSVRPYKRAFSHDEALKIIKEESGQQFDPYITGVFVSASNLFSSAHDRYFTN
ncbi:MAG: response regulator [Clostridiales bacterium]|jgi:putative two-component system response regulator|nr:response regulator [Clostridiales bacterium]